MNGSAYKSAAVFEEEKRRIFDKCQLYLGDKTQLAKPGQFRDAPRRRGAVPDSTEADRRPPYLTA